MRAILVAAGVILAPGWVSAFEAKPPKFKNPDTDFRQTERSSAGRSSTIICLGSKAGLDRVCARDVSKDESCKSGEYGWLSETCLKSSAEDLISEVVSLEDGEPIPLHVIETEAPERIARSIIYRFFQKHERPDITEEDVRFPNYNLYDSAQPILAFNSRYLSSILKSGFLNQHQTRKSYGDYSPTTRRLAEDKLAKIVINPNSEEKRASRVNFLRPKYAFGAFSKPGAEVKPSFTDSYGTAFAVFNADVKSRSFISNDDSLEGFGDSSSRISFQYMTYYKLSRQLRMPPRTAYYESQIWGSLNLKDVSYFLLNCPVQYPSTPPAKPTNTRKFVNTLKRTGVKIPVYDCIDQGARTGLTVDYAPGKRIF
ncbi:MAG: hypothetical protein EOP04_02015 [Proteobacteria bacterium]|nr:MAG: hypothetical protein EOP04_02015 [Pseudomonadota bacterium]